MGLVNVDARQETISRTCRTCAFLRRTHFKKTSKHYGRIIWWCKVVPTGCVNGYLGSTGKNWKMFKINGCEKHQTKAKRRIANDKIRNKILKDTEVARVKRKIW